MIDITKTIPETEGTLGVSAPWITYYRQIHALFDADPNVGVVYDEENNEIKLYVDGTDKANALTQLLPVEKNFGGVTVKTTVIPANKTERKEDLLQAAFEGNPNFSYIHVVGDNPMLNGTIYVLFKPNVAQFWNDNLHDPHGLVSDLYENIARDVIGEDGNVMFSTDEVMIESDDE